MNAITESILKEAADAFAFDRTTGEISRYGEGHINDTFVVWASDKCKRYIMQRINTDTFKNPKELMENVCNVTSFLRKVILENGGDPERETLNVIPTKDRKPFYTQAIPLTDTLFDNDSFCLAGLRSKTIGIYEKNSERKIICDISEYPYTLLWSAPTKPMRFICIEPWQSLPAAETDTSEWNEHAAAACIAPNESYSITLHTTFER